LVVAKNLNSSEAYFVGSQDGSNGYFWLGEGASDDECGYAKKIGSILLPNAAISGFGEGQETDDFWNCFDGGKTEYSSMKVLGFAPGFEPRLFHLSNAQGYIHMKEIYNFM
jgi:hypothetical protein